MSKRHFVRAGLIAAAAVSAAGCAQQPRSTAPIMKVSYSAADRDCMARAMYFESNRSADEGMLAVGTVVANRLKSGRYGSTVCEVVGAPRQFAPGVMTRSMTDSGAERANRVADDVLRGKRHPAVRSAMFFHTAGLRFRYPNMHYVAVAGGNAFYEKRTTDDNPAQARANARSLAIALAHAKTADPTGVAKPIMVASVEPQAQAASYTDVVAPTSHATVTTNIPATPIPTPAPQTAQHAPTVVASARADARTPALPPVTEQPQTTTTVEVAPQPEGKPFGAQAPRPAQALAYASPSSPAAIPAPLQAPATTAAVSATKTAPAPRTIAATAAPVLASSGPVERR